MNPLLFLDLGTETVIIICRLSLTFNLIFNYLWCYFASVEFHPGDSLLKKICLHSGTFEEHREHK